MPADYITISHFNEFKAEMRDFKSDMYAFKSEMYEFRSDMGDFKQITMKIIDEMHTDIQDIKKDILEMKTMLKVTLQLLTVHIQDSDNKWRSQREINQDFENRLPEVGIVIA